MWNDCFALDEMMLSFLNIVKPSLWWRFLGGKIIKILKDILNKYLPTNAHQLVSGKLHVILTRLHDWRSVVVSEFASREDLIQVRAATATLRGEELHEIYCLSVPHSIRGGSLGPRGSPCHDFCPCHPLKPDRVTS